METKISGILFTSKFDSGNLARVERVYRDEEGDRANHRIGDMAALPDYEFNLWTSPDCEGSEFQNGNRSWFHFAVKGCPMSKLVKFNVMNMNRQGKLYNQGMAPVVKVLPQKPRWERIHDRPVCEITASNGRVTASRSRHCDLAETLVVEEVETVDGQFIMSYTYRFEHRYSTVYFAFCYPYSYAECQERLGELDQQFRHCQELGPASTPDTIYYHRELLCKSLDGLQVDLITISSCHGITQEHEPRLEKLFTDVDLPRAFKFESKRVYFLSSRVHPGETPASFVFNGFLDFILRPKDPRSKQLRRQFVFKLIPILNPDGVQRGHYRTDQRGVNLNRVYTNPDFKLHPSVFAAKSVILHHHIHSSLPDNSDQDGTDQGDNTAGFSQLSLRDEVDEVSGQTEVLVTRSDSTEGSIGGCKEKGIPPTPKRTGSGSAMQKNPTKVMQSSSAQGLKKVPNISANQRLHAKFSLPVLQTDSSCGETTEKHGEHIAGEAPSEEDESGNENGDEHLPRERNELNVMPAVQATNNNNSNNNENVLTEQPSRSGIAFYVDLHGHASKRGCFMYGNHLGDVERQVDNLLFPKLIALNSAHFDFDGCNFSEKNMYSKDRKDGMSKEGSGRVAMLKATGITHSYTLECNYNTGRFMNSIAPACMDDGRATPPQVAGFPPKYTIAHFEEVGRALAIAALDFTDSNPWSRIASTEYNSVHGIRAWVQRYLRSMKGAPTLPKKMSRVASKTSSFVATATSRHNLHVTVKPRLVAGDTKAVAFGRAVTPKQSPKKLSKHLGPVRETRASIERKKKITSNNPPALNSTSKSLPSQSVSSRSVDKPSYPAPQTRSHIPPPSSSSSPRQRTGKEPISLSLTHKSPMMQRTSPVEGGAPDLQNRPISSRFPASKKVENARNMKNREETGQQAKSPAQDPRMVRDLLNQIVVKVLEQRTEGAVSQRIILRRVEPVKVTRTSSEGSSPSAFKSFIQRRNGKQRRQLTLNDSKNSSQPKKDNTAQSNIVQKSTKKSSIPRRSGNTSPSKKPSHLKRRPKLVNQPQLRVPSRKGQDEEQHPIHPGIVDQLIQRRLLYSSMSDSNTGEPLCPQITYRSLDPRSSVISGRRITIYSPALDTTQEPRRTWSDPMDDKRYSAPHTSPGLAAKVTMSRSRSGSPMRTLSCQVVDLNTLNTKSQPIGPTKFTWNDL